LAALINLPVKEVPIERKSYASAQA
jgi:hypothetical protein